MEELFQHGSYVKWGNLLEMLRRLPAAWCGYSIVVNSYDYSHFYSPM